ncbi:MAG: NDP-sugar synthase [Thermoplasmata archaeon]|nr:NDP-sugar synthase [Thermoplasmata archaeon]
MAKAAVILAGGLGTRLRPLTYTTPKPLLPVVNRPMILRLMDTFPEDVTTVVIAVSYMAERIQEFFAKNDCGREVIVVNEEAPLGTGGAIKNVGEYLTDSFFVFNADNFSSINLQEMERFHAKHGGIGTIALWEVENPEPYGVVKLGENTRILAFKEKPKLSEAPSKKINAGMYIFNKKILDFIPEGEVSLERTVFPSIIGQGLYGFEFHGYWIDCGKPKEFLDTNRFLLSRGLGKIESPIEGYLLEPVAVGKGMTGRGYTLGPNTCIGNNCTIGEGSIIANSVIFDNVVVGKNVQIDRSIIGNGVKISSGNVITDRVVGDGEQI